MKREKFRGGLSVVDFQPFQPFRQLLRARARSPGSICEHRVTKSQPDEHTRPEASQDSKQSEMRHNLAYSMALIEEQIDQLEWQWQLLAAAEQQERRTAQRSTARHRQPRACEPKTSRRWQSGETSSSSQAPNAEVQDDVSAAGALSTSALAAEDQVQPGSSSRRVSFAPHQIIYVARIPYTAIVGDVRDPINDPNYCKLGEARNQRLSALGKDHEHAFLTRVLQSWHAVSRESREARERSRSRRGREVQTPCGRQRPHVASHDSVISLGSDALVALLVAQDDALSRAGLRNV